MLRLMSDLLPALVAARDGMLKNFTLRWYPQAALAVVLATKGYPGPYAKGSAIGGLDAAAAVEERGDFPRRNPGARTGASSPTAGACSMSARGADSLAEARQRAYAAVDRDRLAARLLPPRHRLARGGAGKFGARC